MKLRCKKTGRWTGSLRLHFYINCKRFHDRQWSGINHISIVWHLWRQRIIWVNLFFRNFQILIFFKNRHFILIQVTRILEFRILEIVSDTFMFDFDNVCWSVILIKNTKFSKRLYHWGFKPRLKKMLLRAKHLFTNCCTF